MKIVCISDTHTKHRQLTLPKGDVLVHAGDITYNGDEESISGFNTWLGEQDFKYKVIIAGNHDWLFEREPAKARSLITNAIYLQDSGVEIEGLKFWGSPIQPWFLDWAFNRRRGNDIEAHWKLIPDDTDVLITHGPPMSILDKVGTDDHYHWLGCWDLHRHVTVRIKPKLHVFGHIHSGYGKEVRDGTIFVNASQVDEMYTLENEPIVVEV
jgi:Icc-related predicted phosphoesterase